MPDISMCSNKECPKKEDCYRAKAEPNPLWQSYTYFGLEKKCQYFFLSQNGLNVENFFLSHFDDDFIKNDAKYTFCLF